ncbi:MAG: hypothetical protein ABJE47_17205 [bacterium]
MIDASARTTLRYRPGGCPRTREKARENANSETDEGTVLCEARFVRQSSVTTFISDPF